MTHRRCCCGNEQPPVPCTGCCTTCPPGTTCTTFPLGGDAWCDAPAGHPCCDALGCSIKFDIQPKTIDAACNIIDGVLLNGACGVFETMPPITIEYQGQLVPNPRPGGCDACRSTFDADPNPHPTPDAVFRRVQLSCINGGNSSETWGYVSDVFLEYICAKSIRMVVTFDLTYVQTNTPCSAAFDRSVCSVLACEAIYDLVSPNGSCNVGGTYQLNPATRVPGGTSFNMSQWFLGANACTCAKYEGLGGCPACLTPPVIDYTLQFPNTITVA